jgi:hypothetical protein
MICMPDKYVRIALTQEEFDRLLEIVAGQDNEPVVLKLRAKGLSHRAKQIREAAARPTPIKRAAAVR